ncbi:MAG: 4-hydroxy-tetrahydrodipicolinate synthase [Myxococcota bacterium]
MTAPASIASRLHGALSAIVTPFDAHGDLDLKALSRLVEVQLERGIDGLVACGTTGETPTLDADEQEKVIRTVVEVVAGRVPVIAGTGSNDTRASVRNTAKASKWGVDAALVVCPYYNKPTQEGLFRHFTAVARDGGLPVVAYNVPGRTVSDLLPETLGRLVEDKAVVAIKDATANMIRTTEIVAALPANADFALLSGDDFTILPFVACGGQGVISVVSNICPGDTARLVRLAAAGQYEEARPLHGRIVALSRALFCSSNPIPLKAALEMGGWCQQVTRLPLEGASEEVRSVVRTALEAYAPGRALDGFMS